MTRVDADSLSVKRFSGLLPLWLLSSVICAGLVAWLFLRLDVPAAHFFWKSGRFLSPLGAAFGSVLILVVELMVMLGILVVRVIRGRVSVLAGTLATACFASVSSYCFNDLVLKVCFGVPGVANVMFGVRHHVHWWAGSTLSSFPSGHMVLAGAFAGVFVHRYRSLTWLMASLLAVAAALLVIGDWHFVSDVVAGAWLGVSAGFLVAAVRAAYA